MARLHIQAPKGLLLWEAVRELKRVAASHHRLAGRVGAIIEKPAPAQETIFCQIIDAPVGSLKDLSRLTIMVGYALEKWLGAELAAIPIQVEAYSQGELRSRYQRF